jgi:nuclear receptor subfamily 5 group A protein 3
MKLEAIREDRTRGGRSTYQCSYTLPTNIQPMTGLTASNMSSAIPMRPDESIKTHTYPASNEAAAIQNNEFQDTIMSEEEASIDVPTNVPSLIQEIMNVEHLWFSTKSTERNVHNASLDVTQSDLPEDNMIQTLTNMADKRLFKLVKWCKSLPLFKNILIDDQISLLINAWCELLVFSCCYRSIGTPGIIRVSNEKSLDLETARSVGIDKWIEKMLHFTDQLRRLKVDHYEYVSMKVIVLLTSDASGLKEPENVRDSQEKVVQALQHYTSAQYSDMPSKFAELLLRMPELHRVCQGCKEMLCPRQAPNEEAPGFNLIMELLRGDH